MKISATMPRSKDGVTRKKLNKEDVDAAIRMVREKTLTIGQASKQFQVKKPTLIYHLNKIKLLDKPDEQYEYCPAKPKKVFTDDEEMMLVEYLVTAANMHYGLSKAQVMRLAYDFAMANKKKLIHHGLLIKVLENSG